MMLVFAVLLAAVSTWALLGWLVRRDRGKVRLTDVEMACRRMTRSFNAMQRTIGVALLPAMLRLNRALREWEREMARL